MAKVLTINQTTGQKEQLQLAQSDLSDPATSMSITTTESLAGYSYNGSPVYVKLIDFGGMPNATSKAVNHNISGATRMVKCEFVMDYTGSTIQDARMLPNYQATIITMTATQITAQSNTNISSFVGMATLYYIK